MASRGMSRQPWTRLPYSESGDDPTLKCVLTTCRPSDLVKEQLQAQHQPNGVVPRASALTAPWQGTRLGKANCVHVATSMFSMVKKLVPSPYGENTCLSC